MCVQKQIATGIAEVNKHTSTLVDKVRNCLCFKPTWNLDSLKLVWFAAAENMVQSEMLVRFLCVNCGYV